MSRITDRAALAFLLAMTLSVACPAEAWAQRTPMEIFRATASAPSTPEADAALKADYAYAVGIQAYLFGLPLVHLDNWRARFIGRNPDAVVNTFIADPKLFTPLTSGGTAPQVDTLYSIGLLALEDGPVIVSLPAGVDRYFSLQITDAYGTNADFTGRRDVGPDGARLFLTGPGYDGPTPQGMRRVSLATNEGMALVRLFVEDDADLPAANVVQNRFTLAPAPASEPAGLAAERFPVTAGQGELAFYDRVGQLAVRNPPGDRLAGEIKSFESVGLDFSASEPANPDDSYRTGLARALVTGPELVAWRIRNRGERVRGWDLDLTGGNFGDDRFLRAAAVTFGLVVNPPSETLYIRSTHDAEGAPLDAAKAYTVTFALDALPECNAFWSLTTYDANFDLVANPENKYSVKDRDDGLIFEADGSLVLHVQRAPPSGRSANWAPTPAEGPFAMTLRCYEPDAIMTDKDHLRRTLPTVAPQA